MMKTQNALIAELQARFPGESQAAIARRAGLSPARFNNYAQGLRQMDDDAVLGCAALVGWDLKKTLASHHAETAHTARERAFWRQLGAAAALAVVALMPLAAHASVKSEPLDPLCIMRNRRRWKLARPLQLFRTFVPERHHGPSPVLA